MKRVLLVILGVCVLLTAGGFIGFRWAAQQPPDFYAEAMASVPAPEVREEVAREFAEQTAQLVDEIQTSPTWEQEFTQDQVNAWLIEELPKQYGKKIPRGLSDPRVQFDSEVVRVGFRFTNPQFSGIVSLELQPKVTSPNEVELTVLSLNAGILPLSPGNFTTDISKQLDRYAVDHAWRVDDGRYVLTVQIEPEHDARPVLEEIDVEPSRLRVAGHRDETPTVLSWRESQSGRRSL